VHHTAVVAGLAGAHVVGGLEDGDRPAGFATQQLARHGETDDPGADDRGRALAPAGRRHPAMVAGRHGRIAA
jgi:hypothetical protein